MKHCLIRRGFFVLRDCGVAAASTCSACHRPVCEEHMKSTGTCVECHGKSVEVDDYHTDAWVHRYRHGYYRRSRYAPIYTGRHYGDGFYSDYDMRSFDKRPDDADAYDDALDDDGGAFMDS